MKIGKAALSVKIVGLIRIRPIRGRNWLYISLSDFTFCLA